MDKNTRNEIQNATQAARKLLEDAYREQLEGTYDILSDGTIAEQAGSHLSDREKITRDKLVAAVAHKRSMGIKAKDAVNAYVREAAFTTLNRFVALKMLEARKLVQECVSKGEDSSGFKEFTALAPGLVAVEDKGYRLYIETLFDEIGQEVKVLFDRRDVASLLWPDRLTLFELLGILNTPKLASVWAEDETIGWVYQYFNGDEERTQMRAESQVPRNSRELAVRNQFFTPRYVVQFLTDNTLGRTWYEMMQGDTKLAHLDYLVLRPNEVFLAEDESAPESDTDDSELSQEELLQQTVHVPFRAKKDPRDLRILDPACGSGHFLLYTFDLLITIYEEAWADEGAAAFRDRGTQLRADYGSIESLRCAMPELILRHNLHGVDIDPRAAQIAALALWMRAQRAYNQFEINRAQRLPIFKTNIVVAEPMPGDAKLVDEFAASLKPVVLSSLFKKMVEEMKLAGELGLLLKIEESIAKAVKEAEEAHSQEGLFAEKIESEDFWDTADEKIIEALGRFSESAAGSVGIRRQLFAGDAAQGVALIELMRKRFDAVLMNPPFGESSLAMRGYVASFYSAASADLGAVFVQRGAELLTSAGRVGAITNRTLIAVQRFAEWRQNLVRRFGLDSLVDLGHGVLDAMVETAMYVCGSGGLTVRDQTAFLGLLETKDKHAELVVSLSRSERVQWRQTSDFEAVPGAPWAYWVPASLLSRFHNDSNFMVIGGEVCPGIQTGDDFRFYRLRWEVPSRLIHVNPHELDRLFEEYNWSPLTKGGQYGLWWDDIYLLQSWARDGFEIKNFINSAGKLRSRPQNLDKLFRSGATFPYRTTSGFGLRFMPPGISFSVGGWAVFAPPSWTNTETLAVYNTRIARYFMEVLLGQGDSSAAGTAARNYVGAAVGGIPWPHQTPKQVDAIVERLIEKAALETEDETNLFFVGSQIYPSSPRTFEELLDGWWERRCDQWDEGSRLHDRLEAAVVESYKLSDSDMEVIAEAEGPPLSSYAPRGISPSKVAALFDNSVEELITQAIRTCGAKRYTVKKAYFIDRTIDLACHILAADAESIISAARTAGAEACGKKKIFAAGLLSWVLGCAVGRFVANENKSLLGPSQHSRLPQLALEESAGNLDLWVDDDGHDLDILSLIETVANDYWDAEGEGIIRGAVEAESGRDDIRMWFKQQFFEYHVKQYSKARRKAPIYWQLATPSASYSAWCYYHHLTRDTFFRVANDFVTPKVDHEERKLNTLRQEAGPDPTSKQRKAIDAQETFVAELRGFLAEVKRVAPLWNPNLNDGVIINFAPLWRLVPQNKAWQKECKKVWDKLVKGDYDWAHLAMHLWPERVVPKCQDDRSLAIAHGLEDEFWYEDDEDKWQKRQVGSERIEEFAAERTSTAVKAALQELLDAPAPGGQTRRRRRAST
ncbi:MAG: BREX-1 system adenine-specific DNA-methyltransferase PglX [Candidatus Thiodiazotropha sp.]